jgi:hypothetical protein
MNLKRMAAPAALAVSLAAPAAHASNLETVVTFDWVSTSYTTADAHPVTPSGSLTLTLPGTITTQTFDTGNLGAAAISDITAFTYTFSDGLSVGLSDLTSPVSPATGKITVSSDTWESSDTVSPAGGPTGIYLISGFNFSGKKTFPPPSSGLAPFQIANTAGLPTNVALDSNTLTPQASQGSASTDAGYWELASFTEESTVPLPRGLPLLLTGLVALGLLLRRPGSLAALPA